MKRITIFLVCFFFGAVSVASAQQGFRVSVLNDAEEPLPAAYIYVNEKAVAVTDTLGRATIPKGKLKLGDSISVSYVATKGQSVAVDRIMLIKGEYEFILEESHGTLHADAVTVKAKIKRLYRRSLPIKRYSPYVYDGLYRTHFTMNITPPRDSVPSHWIAGRLEGIYRSLYLSEVVIPTVYRSVAVHALNPDPAILDSLQRAKLSVGFVNELPLEITTNDDTTGLSHTLKYFLPRALRASNLALYRVYDPEPDYKELEIYPEAKVNYGYLGKDQDTSTFRLIYSGHGAGMASEIVVKSDVTNKINRELVEATLSFKDTINGNSYYVRAKTRIKMISEDRSLNSGGVWQIPVELKYCIKQSDGTRINITMSNIDFRSLWEQMKDTLKGIMDQTPTRFQTRRDLEEFIYYETDTYLKRLVHDKKRAAAKQQKKLERAN